MIDLESKQRRLSEAKRELADVDLDFRRLELRRRGLETEIKGLDQQIHSYGAGVLQSSSVDASELPLLGKDAGTWDVATSITLRDAVVEFMKRTPKTLSASEIWKGAESLGATTMQKTPENAIHVAMRDLVKKKLPIKKVRKGRWKWIGQRPETSGDSH